ncbi:hypothetical protein L210DRAFT_3574739 [Boletus edulis BED1]|uniref:Uncharacterized protein n=1 Tax=Boletus edulis BED1 TaxID=1328754 RepID=A0AAD4BD53_BOLED|nr:hypothetical protein L210DRAFT_3574739 [Boletus edulis BED1]
MRSCRLPYSYPSCATLLNGNETRCQRCLPHHAVRCRAELIAPIQTPTLAHMAMGAGLFAANILCSTHTRRRKRLVVSVQARHSVMGAEHGCKRGTLPFFSLGQ